MNVQDLMTQHPECCGPDTNLAAVTEQMWNMDCGVLPIVENGKLKGIITDRDICIALGTQNRLAGDTLTRDVATGEVVTCRPEDDVRIAMAAMRHARVHRLPVVSSEGEVLGILSLNDIILAANREHETIDFAEVIETLKAVNKHRCHELGKLEELLFTSYAVASA
jgi:CBS domain-containing protein